MRLLSMNLEYSSAWENENLAEVADLVVEVDPDVIAIQECPAEERLQALQDLLGYDYRFGPSSTGLHTALLWRPGIVEEVGGDKYAGGRATWHGFTSSTLRAPGWPCAITFVSAHLIPHDVDRAMGEARFLQTRVRRQGWPGVLVGDINHLPLMGPEPDWDQVPEHNRASRTILDPDRPDEIRGDRTVGLALTRGGLVDVAAHRAEQTGDETLLEHTGVHGLVRVDQAWVTRQLAPAITGYERLDHRGLTDHHPIMVDLDLDLLDPIGRVEFH